MKVLLTIMYDGSKYQGYATQPHKKTIQDVIEEKLSLLYKGPIKTIAASRTDSGVHALDQKVMYEDINNVMSVGEIEKALNSLLPDNIVVKEVIEVGDDFHPRYLVKQKTYKYIITTKREPFCVAYKYYFPYHIDIDKVNDAIPLLLGTNDYTSFCCVNTDVDDKVRTITNLMCQQIDDDIVFSVTGNGFLYNMVRIIVGTLVDVGQGRITKEELNNILQARDRKLAGKTFPPNGLYLVSIEY